MTPTQRAMDYKRRHRVSGGKARKSTDSLVSAASYVVLWPLPGPPREILPRETKTDTGPPSFCRLRRNLRSLFVNVSEYLWNSYHAKIYKYNS